MNLLSYGSFDGIFRNNNCTSFMTYIVDLDAYELYVGDENVFNDFTNKC